MLCILFLGDIVGKPGREAVKKVLRKLCQSFNPDFVIANVENIAHGAGVTREKVEEMLALGVNGFTTGDHVFDVKGVEELLDDPIVPLVRPGNWPGGVYPAGAKPLYGVAGRGWRIIEKNGKRLLLVNLLGRTFMKITADDPFVALEHILAEVPRDIYDAGLLDFHAEATSEKRAIAEAFDGQIDAIIGTHMHVQTNDAQVLRRGTLFLSDAGMCGPMHSILGVDPAIIIKKFRTGLPVHHEIAEGPCEVNGCLVRLEDSLRNIELIRITGVEV